MFYCHSPQLWLLAREARIRAAGVVAADADSPAVDAIAAVVLAAAASEGFINELGTLCTNTRPDSHLPASHAALALKLLELEQDHGSTLDKYGATALILTAKKLPKGMPLYQDFALLFAVRNAVMHIKVLDQSGPREGDMLTFTMPDVVRTLQQKKLAKPSKKEVAASWLEALETEQVATWACKSSLDMILAVLDMMPDFPGDPADHLKRQFRNYKSLP